ncbi:MAG: helix-turn-helix domain-containing protein [Pseudomonas sp.]|nr:helix-turn-helix domain-containing protein [Pseudomonas sp.]
MANTKTKQVVPMSAIQIKQALLAIHPNLTLTLVAKEQGISVNTLSNIIHRRFVGKKGALAICKVLGKTPQEVFPDVPKYAAPVGTTAEAQAILKERLNA